MAPDKSRMEEMRRRRRPGPFRKNGPLSNNPETDKARRLGTRFQILRKEVIQPQVPLRLPCYDFTPVADLTVVGCPLSVSTPA